MRSATYTRDIEFRQRGSPGRGRSIFTREARRNRVFPHIPNLSSLDPPPAPLFAFRTVPRDSAKMHCDRRSSLSRGILDSITENPLTPSTSPDLPSPSRHGSHRGCHRGRTEGGKEGGLTMIPVFLGRQCAPSALIRVSPIEPRTKAISVPFLPLRHPSGDERERGAMSFRQA
jgi:hypothetical protein